MIAVSNLVVELMEQMYKMIISKPIIKSCHT